MSAIDYLENQIINHLLRTSSWTKPTTVYLGLMTAAPGDTGSGGAEVSTSGTNYARISVGPLDANWSSPTTGSTANVVDFNFSAPSANWGIVLGWAMFDAQTAGNMFIYQVLDAPRNILNGDPAPKFLAGDLSITVN